MIKDIIGRLLTKDKNIAGASVFWNAFSAVMNSFQTMVLLMIITRCGSMEDSGIFVMAYAVGNLMLNIGKFGVRQFQVTDVREKYTFSDYIRARNISTVLMLILSCVYIIYNSVCNEYTFKKALVVILICILKAIEAYEDVYHGRMQQMGRLDVAGRILGIRLFVFVFGFAIGYIVTKNLIFATIVNVILTLLLAIMLNVSAFKVLGLCKRTETKEIFCGSLIQECFPLCASMCMNMYIANAPKYVIDTVVNDEIQTCFNIVFMPVFVIALLANFIFQPCLKGLGDMWAKEEQKRFIKNIGVLFGTVVGVCVVITCIGTWIGTDVLGYIYKVDLNEYKNILVIFMLSGGVIALQNLFIMAITVVRYQRYMIFGYAVISLFMLLGGKRVLHKGGIHLLSCFFLAMMLLLLLYHIVLFAIALCKNKIKECEN